MDWFYGMLGVILIGVIIWQNIQMYLMRKQIQRQAGSALKDGIVSINGVPTNVVVLDNQLVQNIKDEQSEPKTIFISLDERKIELLK